MKLVLGFLLFATVSAGQLNNRYPPAAISNTANNIHTLNLVLSEDAVIPSTTTVEAPTTSSNSTSFLSPTLSLSSTSNSPVLYGVPFIKTSSATPPVAILRSGLYSNSQGSYSFEYETGNHIVAHESGNTARDSSKVQGSYSYLAPNGQTISLSYVADENGFHPSGDHLPTPPPIPEAILRSLELNAAEEAKGIVSDDQYLPPSLVDREHILVPSVTTKYSPSFSKQERVALGKIVAPSVHSPTVSAQYLPTLRSDNVVFHILSLPIKVGYK